MSDDKTKRGPRDADRVNVNEGYEVRYWTKKWGVTEARLRPPRSTYFSSRIKRRQRPEAAAPSDSAYCPSGSRNPATYE